MVKKLTGLLKLLRFELPFSAGICVVMGQLLALGEFAQPVITGYGFLSVFFISAAILVLNDYFDVETDRINAPHRPIPAKLVSENEALAFAIILFVAGLSLSFMISYNSLIICAVLTVIGFLYNRYFKKSGLPGNLMVSFSVGMTFIYGGVTVDLIFHKMVLFFGLIAALIDLGEEIAADAMDIEGDLLISSNSVAIRYGKIFAINLSVIIFGLVVILSYIPFLLGWFRLVYLIPISLMDIAIIHSSIKLKYSVNDEGRKYIRKLYLGATAGILVFIVFRFAGF